ncbi:MAG: CehA/McbA family metallohydrolase [Gemmataceae bacterium]|nr:CehA/McbA family metallohydrolase [Gemmataceae bacterium]
MRSFACGCLCVCLVALFAYLGSGAGADAVAVKIRLVDAATGKSMPGLVRVLADKPVPLPGLYDRLRGLKLPAEVAGWHVVPEKGADTKLPRAKLRVQALAGLETAATEMTVDCQIKAPSEITLKLDFLFRPEKSGLVAGNTHLHLMKLTKQDAEDYLKQLPPAELLKVMFISYLERKPDDKDYSTNLYPIGALPQFDATGVLFNNGEEHRHNFKAYGEGYGHVMFLNIKKLVQPVSIGPGIMGDGFDDTPLRPGIDDARKQGGTVIWCHNGNGFEDVLNALGGRLHALNVFDGSRTGSYEDTYYRYLNVGLRMPISTGTDWFLYDFSRVYAQVQGELSIASWLDAVKAGRCQATNSPLLSLKVDGQDLGGEVKLAAPKTLKIEASGVGRHDFQKLQLVHNGRVVKSENAQKTKNGFDARLTHEMRVDGPGWFALRIDSSVKNELDRQLFAHTSPVYVEMKGKRLFDLESGLALLKQIEEGAAAIRAQGHFGSPAASAKLLALYDDGAKELREKINQRRGPK